MDDVVIGLRAHGGDLRWWQGPQVFLRDAQVAGVDEADELGRLVEELRVAALGIARGGLAVGPPALRVARQDVGAVAGGDVVGARRRGAGRRFDGGVAAVAVDAAELHRRRGVHRLDAGVAGEAAAAARRRLLGGLSEERRRRLDGGAAGAPAVGTSLAASSAATANGNAIATAAATLNNRDLAARLIVVRSSEGQRHGGEGMEELALALEDLLEAAAGEEGGDAADARPQFWLRNGRQRAPELRSHPSSRSIGAWKSSPSTTSVSSKRR